MEFNRSYFNTRIIKEMLTYGSFTFLGASGILIIGKVDSIMVASILGLRDLAIYSIAIYIAVLIELPKRAVSHISMPLLSRAFKDGDHKQTADLYRKSAINNLIIGLLIFIGLWINLESLYSLIPRSEIYTIGSMVVIIIGAGKLIDMAAGLNGELIVMSKFYKVNVYLIVGLSFITVVANYYLIPIYGINGAAAGSALALFLFNLSKFIFIYHKLKLQPFSLNTLKVLLIGGSILYVGLELPRLENIYLDILYRSSLVTIIYVIANFILRTSTEVNAIIRGLLKR